MGRLTIMGRSGDTGECWEVGNDGSVQRVKERFELAISKGALAFEVVKEGEPAEQIKAFNPEAREIVLVPQIKGGV